MESPVTLFKKNETKKPNNNERDNIIGTTLKDCRDKNFHSFKFKCIDDINFANIGKFKKNWSKTWKNIV